MTGFHCESQGLPHHLRTFMLGQAKPSPVVFHVKGGERGDQESCSGKESGSHITFKYSH